jgi:CRISPR-associated protein Csb2
MAPVARSWRETMIFRLPRPGPATDDAPLLLRAVRRALMALARDGGGRVPRLFSGHEEDGAPARSGDHEHVFLAADDGDGDGRIDRLLVAAPWTCDRSAAPRDVDRERFEKVVPRLEDLRAGRLGVLRLALLPVAGADDPLLGPARVWESRTPYRPTRHAKRRADPAAAVAEDLAVECLRRSLPRPDVEVLELAGRTYGSISAHVRLRFAVTVGGPLLLGRDSHMGAGMFYGPMY